MHASGLTWKGWFPMPREEIAIINQQLGTTARSSSARAVFEALCDLANTRRSLTFEAPIALVAHVAGVAYKTAQTRLRDLKQLGVIAIESPATGGLDVPHRYTLRSASLTKRTANQTPDTLPTSIKTEKNITPPPPQEFLPLIIRFRKIRPECANPLITDASIISAIEACPAGPDRERGFSEFERDARIASQIKPLRMLQSYMQTAAQGPKQPKGNHHGKSKRDRSGEYAEPDRLLPKL